jgi:Ca2+/Na+ antiporter
MIAGFMGPLPATQASLLVAAILMIIPAVMVFLCVALKSNLNRWLNIGLGLLYIFVNIGNLIGETWAYYIILGII